MGDNAENYTRRNLTPHLLKLKIVERLPKFSLGANHTYEDAVYAYRKRTKEGRAFLALEDALSAWKEQMEEDLLNTFETDDKETKV
jgi:hypothetical protein